MVTAVAAASDFAPPVLGCPVCGAVCKRHSVYPRRIKDISLDGPVILEVRVGNYRCPTCRRFFKPEVPFAGKSKRYTDRAVRKATTSVQQDKLPYVAVPNRLERDFFICPSLSTNWRWFQQFAGSINPEEYFRWACGRFSGQISVDSILDGEHHIWFATDPVNRDLILGFSRVERPNAETLKAFLTELRDKYGIMPLLFTGDDARVYDNTPQEVWPEARLQLCHFHAIRSINRHYLRKSLRNRLGKCKATKPTERELWTDAEHEQATSEWAELVRKRRLFLKTDRNLKKKQHEADFVTDACLDYPVLATFRAFIRQMYRIFDAKSAATANALRKAFVKQWAAEAEDDPFFAHVLKRFRDDKWFGKLFAFTAFENAHRTTNSTERANRWFRKRQKHHYRSRKEHTIRNMLIADLAYRRERTPPDQPATPLTYKPSPIPNAG